MDRFPQWTITKDMDLVTYDNEKGVTKKYKLKLENGGQGPADKSGRARRISISSGLCRAIL